MELAFDRSGDARLGLIPLHEPLILLRRVDAHVADITGRHDDLQAVLQHPELLQTLGLLAGGGGQRDLLRQ
jgi:hypothetical protein